MKRKYVSPELEMIPLVLSDVLNGSEHLEGGQIGTENEGGSPVIIEDGDLWG